MYLIIFCRSLPGNMKISNSQIHRLLVSVVILSDLGLALPHLNMEEAVSENRKSTCTLSSPRSANNRESNL